VLDSLAYTSEQKHARMLRLHAFAASVSSARGWRRAGIAFASGAASALAHAPVHAWPILFLTVPLLVWLIDGTPQQFWPKLKASATIGWWFGFGYFLVGLYWISNALLVDLSTFGWLLPIAVPAVPAGLAVFMAIGVALAGLLWTHGPMRIVSLAVALTVVEWLRGHVLSGFPWNAFGYALTSPLELAQIASVLGLWGLTFLTVLVAATPATLLDRDTRRPWLLVAAAAVALIGLAVFGAVRLAHTPTAFVDGVALRIMQPNLPQDEKFNYSAKTQVLNQYAQLSTRPGKEHPRGLEQTTHLIWPESAFPFYLNKEPDALAQIGALLPEQTVLITGGDRIAEPQPSASTADTYNSIYVIDHRAAVLATYDKLHLVPFGEYLPLQPLLERLGVVQLTKLEGGFASGKRRPVLAVPGAPPMLPLICYEVIFPGDLVPRGERPGWLLNLTNDGWFGISSGPYQHLQQARLRAIEEGLPLVRAANTGISAVIDPLGRIVDSLPLGSEGVLDARLPQSLAPTLYARLGDRIAGALLALALACVLIRRRRQRVARMSASDIRD
jgi:apolipoprotein N-acyltransferase